MSTKPVISDFTLREATRADVPLLLSFVRELAEYEKLSHEVVATEALLEQHLFGEQKVAEALIGESEGEPVAFALFFHNFSTFLGRPGIYLEDLYVKPALRNRGIGRAILARLAGIARERGCARLEWSVLNWNEPALKFYRSIQAAPMNEWTVQRLTGTALEDLAEQG